MQYHERDSSASNEPTKVHRKWAFKKKDDRDGNTFHSQQIIIIFILNQ